MALPPTIDQAIRLIRAQHGKITVGQLADAVLSHGWDVDRDELVERIRALYPKPASTAVPTAARSKSEDRNKVTRKASTTTKKRKMRKSKAKQVYCPRCRGFVVITQLEGVWTFAQHLTKKGTKCPMSGKRYVKPPKLDAMEFRVPGSYGTGKRR